MTEQEAKTRWCPFARVTVEWTNGIAAANRNLSDNEKPLTLCIGSACMAWRRKTQAFRVCDSATATVEPKRPADIPADWAWEPYRGDGEPAGWAEPIGGYCGLAGKQ